MIKRRLKGLVEPINDRFIAILIARNGNTRSHRGESREVGWSTADDRGVVLGAMVEALRRAGTSSGYGR